MKSLLADSLCKESSTISSFFLITNILLGKCGLALGHILCSRNRRFLFRVMRFSSVDLYKHFSCVGSLRVVGLSETPQSLSGALTKNSVGCLDTLLKGTLPAH
jgi:hypothetical protein